MGEVTFYRTKQPLYATIVHPGGAPEWAVLAWLDVLQGRRSHVPREDLPDKKTPVLKLIDKDLSLLAERRADRGVAEQEKSREDTIADLLDFFEPESFAALLEHEQRYSV